MEFSPGAKAIVDLLRYRQDTQTGLVGAIWWDTVLGTVLGGLSPTDAELPLVLADESVWPASRRHTFMSQGFQGTTRTGKNYLNLVIEIRRLAEAEKAPRITEWHIAKVLCNQVPREMESLGLNIEGLLTLLGEREGRIVLSEKERLKTWAFCDTSVFQQYAFFTTVRWHTELRVVTGDEVVMVS